MLRAHFLGGADEVGASAVLVEAGGHRVLVDAGVRMGAGRTDRLPHLALVDELGGLDAVLVTHAHLDHSGALPIVSAAYPRAPVIATPPTLSLLRVLLLDAIKVMEQKADLEEEVPLYPLPAVEALLARVEAAPFLEPVELCGGAFRVTFFPAGHVLGAAAVGIETPEGTALVTGDVSLTDQLTVPGMRAPRVRPDLLVCESTYGGRLHASRRAEEARLADAVLETLEAGGHVLVPAFALGRAQEVLLTLRKALARAGSRATVHADGMVRAICAAYSLHAEALSPSLRERAEAGRGLFFTADGTVRPVAGPEERQAIVSGEPAVVVSSSGMLSGGPSVFYAERLAGREDCLIAITGYQDEEAPGRALAQVAVGAAATLRLGSTTVDVRCRVGTFGLSAHADSSELAGLVEVLRPAEVALVHGDGGARAALAAALSDRGVGQVHLPSAGGVVEVRGGRSGSRRRVAGLGRGRPFDAAALAELRDHLDRRGGAGLRRPWSPLELAEQWLGTDGAPASLAEVRAAIAGAPHLVEADRKRPFLFRFLDPNAAAAPPPSVRDEAGRLEQNAALALADELLGAETGLYKRGADRERWTLRLAFRFPAVAERRHAAALAELEARTGWAVAVNPEPHLAALEQAAAEALPGGLKPARAPSIFKDRGAVRVTVAEPLDEEARAAAEARFAAETGFVLEVDAAPARPTARRGYDDAGRMEVNTLFAEVDRAFAGEAHRPYRKSKRQTPEGEVVELAFVSREVGERYRALVDDLAYRSSWRITIADKVDQGRVLHLVQALLPEGWAVTKGPGLDLAARRVRLRLAAPPPPAELEETNARVEEATGFTVELT